MIDGPKGWYVSVPEKGRPRGVGGGQQTNTRYADIYRRWTALERGFSAPHLIPTPPRPYPRINHTLISPTPSPQSLFCDLSSLCSLGAVISPLREPEFPSYFVLLYPHITLYIRGFRSRH